MKTIKFFILTLFIVLGCSKESRLESPVKPIKIEGVLNQMNLLGKIKSVRQIHYNVEIMESGKITKGKITEDHSENFLHTFNKAGKITEQTDYHENDPEFVRLYKYNSKGILIELTNSSSLDNPPYAKYIFKHDEKGNMVEESYSYMGRFKFKNIYKYHLKGDWEEISIYGDKGEIMSTIKYKYDAKRNIVGENYQSHDKSVNTKNKNYDIIMGTKNAYKYDGKGNMIEKSYQTQFGDLTSSTGKYIYKYDDKGNKVEENNYDSDGKIYQKKTYQYINDSQGNWIKKITTIDTTPISITERKIVYYK